jgi:heme oxygenase
MRGDLDRAERWLKFVERLERINARDAARIQAAMKESEEQAYRDRMRTRIDQRDFLKSTGPPAVRF